MGTKIIDRLSKDLTKAFPDMRGFRARNLKYMRAFAEAYPDKEFVQQVVAQLPWGHQVRIAGIRRSPPTVGSPVFPCHEIEEICGPAAFYCVLILIGKCKVLRA